MVAQADAGHACNVPWHKRSPHGRLARTGLALLKAPAFAALMLVAGTRINPWFLLQMAHLRSRELFIVAIVVITVGTAIGASSVFDVSLALGAFLAGGVISESALSPQVGAVMVPCRATVAVLCFGSGGSRDP